MEKIPDTPPVRTLRDAYKVPGFRVRARIDSYDKLKHPAFVLTLDRRSKKRCAPDARRRAAVCTASAGDGCAISIAGIGKCISTFKCAASNAHCAG